VNEWIRTSGVFDGVIDFEAAARDPAQPDRFLPAFDSGDHLHPSDAGYKAMGESIDLALFRRTTSARQP
jgi:lysophospholipase L1-like esterase